MHTLICVDRDGTLIFDDKYHLGRTDDWKDKIVFCDNVIQGIKALNKLSDTRVYMITNQPGVAIKEFDKLTKERAHEVCQEVLDRLAMQGAPLHGYFLCPHADPDYAKEKKDHTFEKKLVCKCDCIKPDLGMVFDALKKEGWNPTNTRIFVIGDRASDVLTGVHVGGTGILVPFGNETGEEKKVKKIKGTVYVAKDFEDAAKHVKEALQ